MIEHGFYRSEYDSCVYMKHVEDGSLVYLLLYVDDMFITEKDMSVVMKMKQRLQNEFELRKFGGCKEDLGHGNYSRQKTKVVYVTRKIC